MTKKQQLFCEEYLIDLNATQAAIRAGYKPESAGSVGSENLKKPEIRARIDKAMAERSKRTGVNADRVVRELARVAFVMDKLLRKIGLSGRSIVPMLVGFGCTVPGVMASRTLPSERDRKMTILLTPFMSCSAKMPIYGFLAAAFFPGHSAIVMILLYLSLIHI